MNTLGVLCLLMCIYTVKCEPKALLVGCNAAITAIDIDLDVSDCHYTNICCSINWCISLSSSAYVELVPAVRCQKDCINVGFTNTLLRHAIASFSVTGLRKG